jgi:hypothetical protein
MPKKKSLIFFGMVVALVNLFAAGNVLADGCTPLPNITMQFIALELQTDGNYLATYEVTGSKIGDLTSVDLALPKNVNVVSFPSGYHLAAPGAGASANPNWGKNFFNDQILTGSPQEVGDSKLFTFKVSNGGETTGGANLNASRGRSESCAITVPSAFAQEAVIGFKTIITETGAEICVRADPTTQCEVAVDCETGADIEGSIPVSQALSIGDNQVLYVAVPGETCQTFVVDDGIDGSTCYYCSGGRCYPVQCR